MSGTVGSLFSGIGGMDLGLERAGWRIAWQVEKDAHCRAVLRQHWPDVELHEDVRDVGGMVNSGRERDREASGRNGNLTGADVHLRAGVTARDCGGNACNADGRIQLAPVDLICGGFPCQDISVAGRRAGLAGERSGLFHEFMRIVGECAPRWVLIENVAGLLSSNDRRDMGTVLGRLGQLGYWWTWRIVDSQYFGVAQRRERVFIVGHLGAACPPEILLEPESVSGDSPPRREAREGIAPILEAGARTASGGNGRNGCGIGDAGDPMFSLQAGHQHAVAHAVACHAAKGGDTTTDNYVVAFSNRGIAADVFETARADSNGALPMAFDTTQITSPANRSSPQPGDPCHPLASGAHAPAIAEAIPRRLTPRECERLQGFPDDWTRWPAGGREIKDGPRYRMLGNAVTVSVAAWIGARIAEAAA